MAEKEIHPFTLDTIEEQTSWGSECWILADLGFRDSKVRRGELEGNTIGELMETYMDRIVGDETYSYYGRQFPVAVKRLTLRALMPLLVCPDDAVAAERYDSLGKLKLWYVQEADNDAVVYIGLKRDLSAVDFYDACLGGDILEYMNEVPVRKGDCYLINPGTLHCAAKGLTIVEISESSDLDLRICDWSGDSDSIFLEEAFDFVNMSAETPLLVSDDKLVEKEQFVADRIELKDAVRINSAENSSFALYYCIDGKLSVQSPSTRENGEKYMENVLVDAGHIVLVPAEASEYFLMPVDRKCHLIEVLGGIHPQEETQEYDGDNKN